MITVAMGIVTMPVYADSNQAAKTKLDLTKNIRAPPSSSNSYSHDHATNVHFPNSPQLGKESKSSIAQQDLKKTEGNYVAGQPWGSSTVVAKQATQAQQAQNSHQAQNAHQATQAQQAHEDQSSHKSNAPKLQ